MKRRKEGGRKRGSEMRDRKRGGRKEIGKGGRWRLIDADW